MMKTFVVALMVGAIVPTTALGAGPSQGSVMTAQATPSDAAPPKVVEAGAITIRGTVEAVDAEKKTVTLKGPKRSVTLQVRDPQKLEAIKVGDPVVARYYEALAIEVKKPGESTPGVSTQQMVATSKPGETPAGAVGEQINATVTVASIDKKAHTVTVKGPGGGTETIKARDPKNLDKIKAGDLVEVTYTRALAISLDKSTTK
jgi:Cu/Ag efflux protein CusF